MTSPNPAPTPPQETPAHDAAVIDAARLFGAAKEVQIELQGVRYRLRITRRGKLILQK
jgi:hemin uptake protein HemP